MSHLIDSISFGAIVAVRDRLLERQARGLPIYRLESGDPSYDVAPWVREAIVAALDRGETHYTASAGIAPLRKAIVTKARERNRLPIEHPDQVVVTSGGMHALYVAFRALLQPGDEVILPDPMWTEIAENIKLAGGVPVRCSLDPRAEHPWDPQRVAACVTEKTRAIFVNTPHNPTGAVLGRDDLQALVEVARARDLLLVSDEAYEDVLFDGREHVSIGSLPGAEDRTISLYSASKSHAMSGLRIGYILARNEALLERCRKLLRCTTNGVNSLAQWAAVAALSGPRDRSVEMALGYRARRDRFLTHLAGVAALEAVVPQGSFFLWTRITDAWRGPGAGGDDEALVDYLVDEAGVGAAPGSAFGPAGAGWVRFAFSCSDDQVEAGAARLRELMS
jgi:aspartate aminotransferase